MTFLVDTITLDWPCDNSFTSTPSLLSHPRSAGGRADSNGRRSACRLQKGRRSHDCRLAWSVSLPCRRGNGRAFMMVEVFPLPTLPTSLCSTSLSSEFTTSLTHHSSAFNAQNHTETSLALLPSCGESLLVDSMCCVASLGLLVPSILLGPKQPGTVDIASQTASMRQSHVINLPKNLSQVRRQQGFQSMSQPTWKDACG
jgi:hypothetical protein